MSTEPAHHNNDYENGLRDGRLLSLEKTVRDLTSDLSKLKIMIYMLYGAIALVQFLPDIKGFIGAAAP